MSDPQPDRSLRVVTLGTLFLAALTAWQFASPAFAIDDAWISFRIARNLLEHGALTFNLGRPPVEGMTNFLWTLLSAGWIAALPSVDPIHAARALGLLCHLVTIVLVGRLAIADEPRSPPASPEASPPSRAPPRSTR